MFMRSADRDQSRPPQSVVDAAHGVPPTAAKPTVSPASVHPLPPRPANGSQFGAAPGAKRVSVIGSDLAILGADLRIVSRGTVQIEGVVQGDVMGAEVVIGDEGKVTGLIHAERVTIHGTVLGTIRALDVKLTAKAKVEGDIHHNSLALDAGAEFEGISRRPKDKATLVPNLDAAGAQPLADATPSVPAAAAS